MAQPFLAPGIAWALVVIFSVLWIALGVSWGRKGKGDAEDDPRVRVTLELRQSTLQWIDGLREEMGLRHRGAVVSRLLEELAQQPGHPVLKQNA